jgi:hypothetical protein
VWELQAPMANRKRSITTSRHSICLLHRVSLSAWYRIAHRRTGLSVATMVAATPLRGFPWVCQWSYKEYRTADLVENREYPRPRRVCSTRHHWKSHEKDRRVMTIARRIMPVVKTIAPPWEMLLLPREYWTHGRLLIWGPMLIANRRRFRE